MPWHEFWLLCCRTGQFSARQFLYRGDIEDAAVASTLEELAFPYARAPEPTFQAPATW